MHSLTVVRWSVLALATISLATLGALLAQVPAVAVPRLGHQGQKRHHAHEELSWFRGLEPFLRYLAGLASLVPLRNLRGRQDRLLASSGYPLGLTSDELSALSLVSGLGVALLAWVPVVLGKAGPGLLAAGLAFGIMLPTLRICEIRKRRAKEIGRELPHGIEIAAMCMGAGLDFPGAIRLLTKPTGSRRPPLGAELQLVLEELELGHTRREAFQAFGKRIPSDAVRDFVNAVVQAEERGTPLAQVLRIQGQVLGRRRSTRAEEAAARAGVMLVVPLLLLLTCVLILLVGPAVLRNEMFR